jgi:hypothetical protein
MRNFSMQELIVGTNDQDASSIFHSWIANGGSDSYLTHALSHLDAPHLIATAQSMGEVYVKSHFLCDMFSLITNKRKSGLTDSQIYELIIGRLMDCFQYLTKGELNLRQVTHIHSRIESFDAKNQPINSAKKCFVQLLKVVKYLFTLLTGSKFKFQHLMLKFGLKRQILLTHLETIVRESFLMVRSILAVLHVLNTHLKHDVVQILEDFEAELNTLITSVKKSQPINLDCRRFNNTLRQNLDHSFYYTKELGPSYKLEESIEMNKLLQPFIDQNFFEFNVM